ncbi:hypothetical protein [Plantactinospora sp. GCM10030261]|uniref:hypothetical protein n=1 Tax=Plantactinospora sp. GCM10030261 TaxID=3273420 RepID=UPI00361375BE
MLSYRYLIAYAHSTGYGSIEFSRSAPITCTDDLTEVLDYLRRKGGATNPFILSFSRFDNPAPTRRATS